MPPLEGDVQQISTTHNELLERNVWKQRELVSIHSSQVHTRGVAEQPGFLKWVQVVPVLRAVKPHALVAPALHQDCIRAPALLQ